MSRKNHASFLLPPPVQYFFSSHSFELFSVDGSVSERVPCSDLIFLGFFRGLSTESAIHSDHKLRKLR